MLKKAYLYCFSKTTREYGWKNKEIKGNSLDKQFALRIAIEVPTKALLFIKSTLED